MEVGGPHLRSADSDQIAQPHDANEKQRNKSRPPCIDADALADPRRCELFERRLAYVSNVEECNAQGLEDKVSPAGIDERLRHWNHLVLALARNVFGAKPTGPKKLWISTASWDIVQWIAPTRRRIHSCQAAARDYAAHIVACMEVGLRIDRNYSDGPSGSTGVLDDFSILAGGSLVATTSRTFAAGIT